MDKYFFSQRILPNNLRVLYLPLETTEMVYISLIGKVGRRAEKDNEIGAAHFLEHLFFDGTRRRPNAFELNKFIDEQGSGHDGLTRTDTVEYLVKILADKVEYAFDYISDIVFNSLLREEDIEKERKVIFQEITMRKDSPEDVLGRRRQALLYPNQAIGRSFFDEEGNLQSINRDILRGYMKRNYVAQNFVLAISGNISEEKAFSLSEKYFGQFSQGNETFFEEAKIEKEQKIEVIHKNFEQAKFSVNFRGFPTASVEHTRAAVLARLLCYGFSSRLYDRLRTKKHLIYSVRSQAVAFPDTGYFFIDSKTSEDKLQELVSEIFKEIAKLLNEGITEDELNKAKNISLFNFLSVIEDLEKYTYMFSMQVLFQEKIKRIEERIDEIKGVTKEELMETAKFIFSDKPKIVAITKSLDNLEVN